MKVKLSSLIFFPSYLLVFISPKLVASDMNLGLAQHYLYYNCCCFVFIIIALRAAGSATSQLHGP